MTSPDARQARLTKEDADTAKALLRQMREPETTFSRVTESCLIGEGELVRRIEVEISKSGLSGESLFVTDLVHPEKGAHVDVRLRDATNIRRLQHAEHIRVSQNAILFRMESVRRSIKLPARHAKQFSQKWAEFVREIQVLPRLSPRQAQVCYDAQFDPNVRMPRIFGEFSGLRVAVDKVQRLHDLCKRLVDRYLLLVEFKPAELTDGKLVFEYRHEINEQEFRHGIPVFGKRSRVREFQYADQERSHPRRRIHYGSVPVSFRIHLPWVKRCHHYSFHLDAGPGYYIAFQHVLEKPPFDVPRNLDATGLGQPKYSLDSQQGRRSHLFMTKGRGTRYPAFLALRHEEIPGRTTARAFRLSWFVFLVLGAFGVQSHFVAGQQLAVTASLFVALMAIGAFVSAPHPGPGVMGYPLLSRFTPVALGFISAIFALWLGARSQTWQFAGVFSQEWIDLASPTMAIVSTWGWSPLTLAALTLAVTLSVRRHKIAVRYLAAQKAEAITSPNFFDIEVEKTI